MGRIEQNSDTTSVCNFRRKGYSKSSAGQSIKKEKISLSSNKAAILQLTDPILC
jgi:hypothetical protein